MQANGDQQYTGEKRGAAAVGAAWEGVRGALRGDSEAALQTEQKLRRGGARPAEGQRV